MSKGSSEKRKCDKESDRLIAAVQVRPSNHEHQAQLQQQERLFYYDITLGLVGAAGALLPLLLARRRHILPMAQGTNKISTTGPNRNSVKAQL